MKPILFLPPVATLLAVSLWISQGRSTITTLEEQSAVLRQRLASRSTGTDDGKDPKRPDAPAKSAKEAKPIDWKEFAAQMVEMRTSGGMSDMGKMIRIQQRIQAMSREELAAALDEIRTEDLPDESKDMLEQMLIGPLCQKDPEFALNRYKERLNDVDGGFGWQLSNAMREWAGKDSAAATAWFDAQIADGKFDSKSLDGKNRLRLQFEGNLIGALISTDPAAVSARLQALPEDQRKEVLRNHAGGAIKEEDQLAFADLVRKDMPQDEQADVIAQQAARQAWRDGYTGVDEYLDRIKATPAERAESVVDTLATKMSQLSGNKKITREDIDGMREWAATQSPDTTDRVTGNMIARSMNSQHGLEFSEAAALASDYHGSSGNDDVLVEFFKRSSEARRHKEEAIQLAGKITDPARRAEVIKNLN